MTGSLDPIPDSDWPEDIRDLLPGFAGRLDVYRTMAHHPALLRAWVDLREHIVRQGALGPDLTEVVILRTGARLGSDYEWGQHVLRSRALGFSDDRIRSIRGRLSDMAPADALLARAVDEVFDSHAMSRETRNNLIAAHGPEGALDLLATVGFYRILGAILLTFETPLDTDAAEDLARNPID